MKELEQKVVAWAEAKGLIFKGNEFVQFAKTLEEVEEVRVELESGNDKKLELEIGDTGITLINVCAIKGLTLEGCIRAAYAKIKDRKGETINGDFVREK